MKFLNLHMVITFLQRKILKRKFTCFEDGIKVCIESEIRHEK